MGWPNEEWAMLIQTVFVGKAREVYTAMPNDLSRIYAEVKRWVLRAYELVPEAYRQKFRQLKKETSMSHVEFAHVKIQHFDRWLTAKEVGEDFHKLRQLILVEEFKRQVHPDIKTYLNENEVQDVHDAAVKADDYALTHRHLTRNLNPNFNSYGKSQTKGSSPNQPNNQYSNQQTKGEQIKDETKTKTNTGG